MSEMRKREAGFAGEGFTMRAGQMKYRLLIGKELV